MVKSIIALLSVIVLVSALAGCSSPPSADTGSGNQPSAEQPATGDGAPPVADVTNPVEEVTSINAINDALEVRFVLPAAVASDAVAHDVRYFLYSANTADALGEATYTLDGAAIVQRIKPAVEADPAVAGMYFDFPEVTNVLYEGYSIYTQAIDGQAALAYWYDESSGATVTVATTSAQATADFISAIAQSVIDGAAAGS